MGKKVLFGIAGKKRVGKDTVASMIHYIIRSGIYNCNYNGYLVAKNVKPVNKSSIAYADYLKNLVNLVFGVPLDLLYSDNKDSLYINLSTNMVYVDEKKIPSTYNVLTYNELVNCISYYDTVTYLNNVICVRVLLQTYSDQCKKIMGDDIFIRVVERAIREKIKDSAYYIITDVRYKTEQESIYGMISLGLKPIVIEVVRDTVPYGGQNEAHESETYHSLNATHTIDNNATEMTLFYKVLDIVTKSLN